MSKVVAFERGITSARSWSCEENSRRRKMEEVRVRVRVKVRVMAVRVG